MTLMSTILCLSLTCSLELQIDNNIYHEYTLNDTSSTYYILPPDMSEYTYVYLSYSGESVANVDTVYAIFYKHMVINWNGERNLYYYPSLYDSSGGCFLLEADEALYLSYDGLKVGAELVKKPVSLGKSWLVGFSQHYTITDLGQIEFDGATLKTVTVKVVDDAPSEAVYTWAYGIGLYSLALGRYGQKPTRYILLHSRIKHNERL